MATSSTPLALHCGAGVPVPRCNLRRNLVSKTQKTTVMGANPAVQYEAAGSLALVSTPSQLHRNLVTKRDKTITAAYPINIQYQTDIPEYTEGILENFSGEVLKLDDKTIWKGSRSTVFPFEVPFPGTGRFIHKADNEGSIGGLEYKFGDGKKWIIAWSNHKNELNKVYTQIFLESEVVDWDQIHDGLKMQHSVYETAKLLAEVVIDPTSAKPTLKATLKPVLLKPVPLADGKPESNA